MPNILTVVLGGDNLPFGAHSKFGVFSCISLVNFYLHPLTNAVHAEDNVSEVQGIFKIFWILSREISRFIAMEFRLTPSLVYLTSWYIMNCGELTKGCRPDFFLKQWFLILSTASNSSALLEVGSTDDSHSLMSSLHLPPIEQPLNI